jgi:hypothetical protein
MGIIPTTFDFERHLGRHRDHTHPMSPGPDRR